MAACAVLFALGSGCRQAPEQQNGGAPVPALVPEAGKQLFAHHCAPCHGTDGRGGVGPDLSATRYRYGKYRDDIVKTISSGRPGGMPAFGSQLSAAEIAALADHLLTPQR